MNLTPEQQALLDEGSKGETMAKKMSTIRRASYTRADRTAPGHEVEVKYIAAIAI